MRRWLLYFLVLHISVAIVWAQGEISIEGTLLMLDGKTPHVAVPVEAISNGEVVKTVLSDENGEYLFQNLEQGQYQVRCQVLGGYVYYQATDDALRVAPHDAQTREKDIGEALYVGRGTLGNINFRFAPFKKGIWKTYTYLDGLAGNAVKAIHQDPDGIMWFGMQNSGVSRYDGRKFVNFTTRDGLAHNGVWAVYSAPDGALWFGTKGGVSRYDGKTFVSFTTEDGLAHNYVTAIHGAPDDTMWFGTGWLDVPGSGVSRYDGNKFTNFTKEDGLAGNTVLSIHRAPDGAMWFGTEAGISRYDGREFANFIMKDGWSSNIVKAIHADQDGAMWFGTLSGVYQYDGKEFTNYTTRDGLPHNWVSSIYEDPGGVLWFATGQWATAGGGVSRYDGKTFVNYTVQDGLASNFLFSVYRSHDGAIWFGTDQSGVSRYDGEGVMNLTTRDGLSDNWVDAIHRASDGNLWFGTKAGVSRYDGKEFANIVSGDVLSGKSVLSICNDSNGGFWFGAQDGSIFRYDGEEFEDLAAKHELGSYLVRSIHHSSDGAMWFGTWYGAYYYDGQEFISFTKEDGLAGNAIGAIHQDIDGDLWLGTRNGGVSRYDGKEFVNFTQENGLADNWVYSIHSAPDGSMWFGTHGGGVSHYDGKEFRNFTSEDGLAGNVVSAIHSSADGVMWFGTAGGGVSQYDGVAWASLDKRDGLADNNVWAIQQDEEGYLWFGTLDGGVTRYRRSTIPPKVRIVSVRTRKQIYTELDSIPPIRVDDDITIECGAIDFRTVPEKRQYRYRIQAFGKSLSKKEIDSDWRKPAKSAQFDWTPEEPGTYAFEVQAIDRDLNYSEPASVSIAISASPFHRTGAFLVLVITMGSASLFAAILLGIQRWRLAHSEKLRLQQELEDAHRMQVRLLPETAPSVEGFDIAGSSRPAREVGGDFFDYLSMPNGEVGIAIADVSGKGLQGAMHAVLANGMLHDAAEIETSCGKILSRLNAGLYPRIERQMFTALGLAILNRNDGKLYWANAAQPHPLVKRGEQVFEFECDGEVPLGMMPDISYSDWELELQVGDIAILYTDGVIEAENDAEEMYGTERLMKLVAGIDSAASSEDVIEAILNDVSSFAGTADQYDDMTVVVLRRV